MFLPLFVRLLVEQDLVKLFMKFYQISLARLRLCSVKLSYLGDWVAEWLIT